MNYKIRSWDIKKNSTLLEILKFTDFKVALSATDVWNYTRYRKWCMLLNFNNWVLMFYKKQWR